jgi:hypothetical protein
MREIVNGIFYVMRAGCPWRLLPSDLPPWSTIYRWFAKFRDGEELSSLLLKHMIGKDICTSGPERNAKSSGNNQAPLTHKSSSWESFPVAPAILFSFGTVGILKR